MDSTLTASIVHIGTRGSALARWQTDHVRERLQAIWKTLQIETQIITTTGDKTLDTPLPLIGGKGVFTAELESALHSGAIDMAVHSLKDLPTESPAGLTLGAIIERANPADVMVSRSGYTLDTLPEGAAVGTSSRRRGAQILHHRPDLRLIDIRGNVDTRIRKALDPDGPYDAIVLARAGLERLEHTADISETLSLDVMLPAPGQGALAVQCRDDEQSRALLAPLNHRPSQLSTSAERAFLEGLGGGCSLPIAAFGFIDADMTMLHLHGRVLAADGSACVNVSAIAPLAENGELSLLEVVRITGIGLAQAALVQGASNLLARGS